MRFKIARCEYQKNKDEDGEAYEGPVIVLTKNGGLSLFFPILDHTAKLIKYIFEVHNEDAEEDEDIEDELEYGLTNSEKENFAQSVGIYQTMVNLWRDSGLFLSGIVMDASYSVDANEDMIVVYMVLSDEENGFVSSVVRINFQHALILAALLDMDVNVNEMLLHKIIPGLFDEEEDDETETQHMRHMPINNEEFPVDSKLLDMARNLLRSEGSDQKKPKKKDDKKK